MLAGRQIMYQIFSLSNINKTQGRVGNLNDSVPVQHRPEKGTVKQPEINVNNFEEQQQNLLLSEKERPRDRATPAYPSEKAEERGQGCRSSKSSRSKKRAK